MEVWRSYIQKRLYRLTEVIFTIIRFFPYLGNGKYEKKSEIISSFASDKHVILINQLGL